MASMYLNPRDEWALNIRYAHASIVPWGLTADQFYTNEYRLKAHDIDGFLAAMVGRSDDYAEHEVKVLGQALARMTLSCHLGHRNFYAAMLDETRAAYRKIAAVLAEAEKARVARIVAERAAEDRARFAARMVAM